MAIVSYAVVLYVGQMALGTTSIGYAYTAQDNLRGFRHKTTMSEEKPSEAKPQRKLLIPGFLTPSAIKGEERKAIRPEKRLRVRRRTDVDEGKAKINPETIRELQIFDKVEIVVVGGGSRERRYVFTVIPSEDVPKNEVWCNEEEMRRYGIADNTIATVRAYRGEQPRV